MYLFDHTVALQFPNYLPLVKPNLKEQIGLIIGETPCTLGVPTPRHPHPFNRITHRLLPSPWLHL